MKCVQNYVLAMGEYLRKEQSYSKFSRTSRAAELLSAAKEAKSQMKKEGIALGSVSNVDLYLACNRYLNVIDRHPIMYVL